MDPKQNTSARKKKKTRHWVSTQTFSRIATTPCEDDDSETGDMNMVNIWELIFTDEIITLLVDISNRYASQKNHFLNVSPEEMKVYIIILLLYITPKNIRMFWEVILDVHNELVASVMRRNQFLEIHQYLHACDNLDLPENDKFAKLARFFALLNSLFLDNFKSLFSISRDVSIEETMVPYYGRYSCKQHIHGKPIRFGYKLWSACTALQTKPEQNRFYFVAKRDININSVFFLLVATIAKSKKET